MAAQQKLKENENGEQKQNEKVSEEGQGGQHVHQEAITLKGVELNSRPL